jgi:hypothetical protein
MFQLKINIMSIVLDLYVLNENQSFIRCENIIFSIELKKFGIVILSSFYRVKQTVYEEPVKESSYK